MSLPYTRHPLKGRQKRLQRFFEIIPGGVSWSILLGLTALSWLRPTWTIVFILAFDLYWILFLLYTMGLTLASHVLRRAERQTDWLARARQLTERLETQETSLPLTRVRAKGLYHRLSERIHECHVRALIESRCPMPTPEAVYQVIIVPILTEGRDIIESCLASLLAQDFPKERMLVMFALEERAAENVKRAAWDLHREHNDAFCGFYISPHQAGVEGESPAKGANITYAAKMAIQALEQKHIPLEHVVVTCLDSDAVMDPCYLSCLTYHYMVCPQRERASFRPIPVYQSIALSALRAAGYWSTEMVSDDSALFWKAFLHFKGDFRVVPMPITLAMDVVQSETFWETVKSVYQQRRRWACGIENFPIVMRGFLNDHEIPTGEKFKHAFKMLHKHVLWSTWAFLLLVIGGVPGLVAAGGYHTSIAYYMAPHIQSVIFRLASVGLILTVVHNSLRFPKPPAGYPLRRRLWQLVAWLWIPLASTILSALPALDAQTRLMLGKDLAFIVTDKKRKRKERSTGPYPKI